MCPVPGCHRTFKNHTGLGNHLHTHDHLNYSSTSQSDSDSDVALSDDEPNVEPVLHWDVDFDPNANFDASISLPPQPDDRMEAKKGHKIERQFHAKLNGRKCDSEGNVLPEGAPPPAPSPTERQGNDWRPWQDGLEFRMANLLYRKMQASAGNIDELMEILAARAQEEQPLFADHTDLYSTIDVCTDGAVPWEAFSVKYDGPWEEEKLEPWMDSEFMVYYQDLWEVLHRQLGNPDFIGEMETTPYQAISAEDGKRQYQNFISGNWAMREADKIVDVHPDTEGAMLCATITGSDKTTVSVATGQNDYYPAYLSNSCLTNNARRSHCGGVSLFMFLAIPKTTRDYQNSPEFRKFCRHIFHQSLRLFMTKPDLVRFGDGYYRRVVYSIGPYIGDYPEQVLLACIVQGWCARCTADHKDLDGPSIPRSHEHTCLVDDAMPSAADKWDAYGIISGIMPFTYYFPRADIHALIAPDILHQLIKGTYKDHLVTWIQEYLELENSKAEAARIMADIDQRIAAAPLFPALWCFPEGRGFKQWTGNDSKALMKVYLAAIAGRVPDEIVQTIAAFTEFCYLVRRDVITEDTIYQIGQALDQFHKERVIFEQLEVRDTFSLPRQHSLIHYPVLIAEFGSPNGLCSSITESKHIAAVKEPWRWSSCNQPLSETLVINEWMDKLEWAEADFRHRGMLSGPVTEGLSERFAHQADIRAIERLLALQAMAVNPDDDEDDDGGPVDGKQMGSGIRLACKHVKNLPRHPDTLGPHLKIDDFSFFLKSFIYEQNLPPINATT
ncbi:hypothetical protein D9758_017736 [Tetrapyrgos nigripes]|uniref:C2H2-type domain-containing protein n=1 Tax=Tetrapyrgos nigripes TaxID=182062 RepID=A0A8H5BKQ4_9AGAR|nr:hypothetical protein D9758_017736 [Tetrapyrgos nigripes]